MQLLMRRPEIDCFVSVSPPANSCNFALPALAPLRPDRRRREGQGGAARRHRGAVDRLSCKRALRWNRAPSGVPITSITMRWNTLAVDVSKYIASAGQSPGRATSNEEHRLLYSSPRAKPRGLVSRLATSAWREGLSAPRLRRSVETTVSLKARRGGRPFSGRGAPVVSGKGSRQAAQRAHGQEGESLRLERVAVPAETVGRHDLAACLLGDRFQQGRITCATTRDHPLRDRRREVTHRQRDRARRSARQRGRAVGDAEAVGP